MLLNTEELLALAHGDVEPDRLADLLDRLEHCSESAAALQVLVSLRANREEALEALRLAAQRDATSTPVPHPSAWRPAPSAGWGWATQGLRLAASVALVAVIGAWAASSFFAPGGSTVDFRSLATDTYHNSVGAGVPPDAQLTAGDQAIREAYKALSARDFVAVKDLLQNQPNDADGKVPLFLGMSEYFLGNHAEALAQFVEVRTLPSVSQSSTLRQAAWYEANAMLALNQPMNAIAVLETLKSVDPDYKFQSEATEAYDKLSRALGINTSDSPTR